MGARAAGYARRSDGRPAVRVGSNPWLRSLLRKEQGEREADEEVRSFLEMAVDEKMKEGMNREEVARAVRLERGSLEITKVVGGLHHEYRVEKAVA